MAIVQSLQNGFINQVLKRLVEHKGTDEGTNILAIVVTPLLANHVNWMLAAQGFHFQDAAAVAELAKATGIVLMAFLLWATGKWPWVGKLTGFAKEAEAAAEAANEQSS